jgi:hypothetical protein
MTAKAFIHDVFKGPSGKGSRGASVAGEAGGFQEMTMAEPAMSGVGWQELWKTKNFKGMLKKPGGIMAALFLAQMVAGHIGNKIGAARDQGLQQELIGQQMGMSEEDAYYQAALPSLTQERQVAQNALLQAIMSGRGQEMQVPGERRI